MSFAENLKQIRKERHLSQEELAEILDVSRQAVSKWEQGTGYPEVEKLLVLSNKLNISLDSLMETEIAGESQKENTNVTGNIVITSPKENVIVTCYKVCSTGKMKGGKTSPQYALFGISRSGVSFFGEPTTFLGWYANKEQIEKEISDIQNAIREGIPTYELKYDVKVEKSFLRVKMAEENNFYDHYIGKKCSVEMSDWNDGVFDSYLVGQNDKFIFYVTIEKKQKKIGALAKQYISRITLCSKKDKTPIDLAAFSEMQITYFLEKPVNIELNSKYIWDGILGEDTELLDVGIADIGDEYVKLVTGKEIETSKITKIEMTLL